MPRFRSGIAYAGAPRTLPVVLSADEVVRFLEAVPSLKARTALTTAYAAGLRASETVGLKVCDIDSQRGVIRVEHGKGGKDRTVMRAKYYVSNLPADATIRTLAATIKARWVCEQAHQQLKEELRLNHFEGRSWTGLHRNALMTMIAYAFLQSRRIKAAERENKRRSTAATN